MPPVRDPVLSRICVFGLTAIRHADRFANARRLLTVAEARSARTRKSARISHCALYIFERIRKNDPVSGFLCHKFVLRHLVE